MKEKENLKYAPVGIRAMSEEFPKPHGLEEIPVSSVGIAGQHYAKCKIQPIDYAMANELDACQFSVVKYVTRFRDKNGLEDLKKAKFFIDKLIELEYGKEGDSCQDEHEGSEEQRREELSGEARNEN